MIRTNKGFTMIELMVVIVIMGVLAVLAIPKLTDVITKAKFGEIPICMGTWEHAMLAYHSETGKLATDILDLPIDADSTSKWFTYEQDNGSSVYQAYPKVAVGPYPAGKANAAKSTAAGPEEGAGGSITFTHALDGFAKKYLPNFVQ